MLQRGQAPKLLKDPWARDKNHFRRQRADPDLCSALPLEMGNKEICARCLRLSKIPKTLWPQRVEGKKECRTSTINLLNAKYESCSTWISILNKPKGPRGTLSWATPSFPEMNVMFCWRWRLCHFTAFQNKLYFRKFLKTHREPHFLIIIFLQMTTQDAEMTWFPLKLTSNRKEMRFQRLRIFRERNVSSFSNWSWSYF